MAASSTHAVGHATLLSLPDELVDNILSFLPLRPLLSCQLSCKRLHLLSQHRPLWRRHCREEYRFWRADWSFDGLLEASPATVDWKQLLVARRKKDRNILQLLDGIIGLQSNRLPKMQNIVNEGYDAKDILQKQMAASDDVSDVLARRYFAAKTLGCLERTHGVGVWTRLANAEDVPLERALGVFDLMIAEKPPESLDQISHHLDMIATAFENATPGHELMSTRSKACAVASFLCDRNLTGLQPGEGFRDLKNTLISVALCEKEHPSIPIISTAIFVCVAQRLGMNAHPCNFPGKIIAVILPPEGMTLDGTLVPEDQSSEAMFIDPSYSGRPLEEAGLRSHLSAMGIPPGAQAAFLHPASTIAIVQRTARNIEESIRLSQEFDQVLALVDPSALRAIGLPDHTSLQTVLSPDCARYAVTWASVLFTGLDGTNPNLRETALRAPLAQLAHSLRDEFRADVNLFTRHVFPIFRSGPARAFGLSLASEIAERDMLPPAPQTRTGISRDKVTYFIGQVYTHKRYGYRAAITGWDTRCKADDNWIRHQNVDSLRNGREQCFYHVLVEDLTSRYVAEENIEIETPQRLGTQVRPVEPPKGLMREAGKFFKRWDSELGKFISNVRDQYPDD